MFPSSGEAFTSCQPCPQVRHPAPRYTTPAQERGRFHSPANGTPHPPVVARQWNPAVGDSSCGGESIPPPSYDRIRLVGESCPQVRLPPSQANLPSTLPSCPRCVYVYLSLSLSSDLGFDGGEQVGAFRVLASRPSTSPLGPRCVCVCVTSC